MSSKHSHVRRPFQQLAVFYFCIGLAALAISWTLYPPRPSLQFILLVISVVVVENFAVSLPGYGLSLAYPLAFSAILLCGPTEGLLVAAVSMLSLSDIRARPPAVVHAFNLGQQLICMALAACGYMFLGGRVLMTADGIARGVSVADFPAILVPLIAAAIIGAAGNVLLAASGYAARSGKSLSSVISSVYWVLSAQMLMAAVGLLIAQVMAISSAALLLFIIPLVAGRQLYQSYSALNDAYYDTIRSIVAALEAKDPYTRGHSERVVMYAERLASRLGLPESQRSDVTRAALLHDIGKLAVPGRILRKTDELTDDEWAAIRLHPAAGADMISRIPALRRLASAVAQHHERLDGSGYPAGIRDLDVTARILAIADSYDAMTSDRPYRQGMAQTAALEELRRLAGVKYDPDFVEAFAHVLQLAESREERMDSAFAILGLEGDVA